MKFKFKSKPYFIAEVGVNHENNLNLAEKIIKQASIGGASAVKFQTYKAELIASKKSPAYWDTSKVKTNSQFKLFKKYDKFCDSHYVKLKKICDYYKVDFLSTPFDNNSALMLNKLVRYFKIASADINNKPLLDCILKFNKPIIFSTGASHQKEIDNTYNYLKKNNNKIDIAILHCILSYPTNYRDCNLNAINFFIKRYKNSFIGLSDHTIPDENMIILTKAYELGAVIIEKHFTEVKLKGKKNNDHFHSINFIDLKKFFENIKILKQIVNNKFNKRKVLKCEDRPRKFARRSMYSLNKIRKGEILSETNIVPKRPGLGISPLDVDKLYGKIALKNLNPDTLINWKDLK